MNRTVVAGMVLPPELALIFLTVPLIFYSFLKFLSRVLIHILLLNSFWVFKTYESISWLVPSSYWLNSFADFPCLFFLLVDGILLKLLNCGIGTLSVFETLYELSIGFWIASRAHKYTFQKWGEVLSQLLKNVITQLKNFKTE